MSFYPINSVIALRIEHQALSCLASENQNMPMLALQFLLPPKPISHFLKFISCDDDSAALGNEENRDFLDYAFVARFAEAVVFLIAKLPPY